MLIHLLRHADAETISPTGLDSDRRLTRDGLKRMSLVAAAIKKFEPRYDEILISALVRARETAEPVASVMGFRKPLLITPNLNPGAGSGAILHELARLGPKAVLLVGHMPHMGSLFARLLTGDGDCCVNLKKASLAAFESGPDPSAGKAELKFYLPARFLELLT